MIYYISERISMNSQVSLDIIEIKYELIVSNFLPCCIHIIIQLDTTWYNQQKMSPHVKTNQSIQDLSKPTTILDKKYSIHLLPTYRIKGVAEISDLLWGLIFLNQKMQCKIFLVLHISNWNAGWFTKLQISMFKNIKYI